MEFTLKNTHVNGVEIRPLLEEKTSRLERFFQGRIHAKWTISYENDEHVSLLHVVGNVGEYYGEARHPNIMGSIDDAIDRVERQLIKHKEILKERNK